MRPDWSDFRTIDGLCRRAGVAPELLRRLVLKELVDNALDATDRTGATATCTLLPDGFVVENGGDGLPGSPEQIADLFSIARPLTSSKLLRLPTRGALGNGLRVVAGAVLASGGTLAIWTRNQQLRLYPQDAGDTRVEVEPVTFPVGTRIEVTLGPSIPTDSITPALWAADALLLREIHSRYAGKSSPHWYDADSFFELLQATGAQPVRSLVAALDGCSGATAGHIIGDAKARAANTLSRSEASALLERAQARTTPVRPERLGSVGKLPTLPDAYAKESGTITISPGRGGPKATVPFVVEVWADSNAGDDITMLVNCTPVTQDVHLARLRERVDVGLFGCGLRHGASVGKAGIALTVHITTPYMPITSDGKAPDLGRFHEVIVATVEKAAKSARRRAQGTALRVSDKAWILRCLAAGIDDASGNGAYRYSQRQLYYSVRTAILNAGGPEPSWSNFCGVLTDYEKNTEDLEQRGLYRDTRGLLYHPHLRQTIPLGTLSVEQYQRPDLLFNKILYSEKEGFFPTLIDTGWPERHDCALLTSKGFATRAARDLLDLLGDTDEDLLFFCIHDADGPGTRIYQALQEDTSARPARRVRVINLGLEPDQALNMGLAVEPVTRKDDGPVPVASYVAPGWAEWLQTQRVELNSMSSPVFVAWLDEVMEPYDQGKLIPPADVLAEELAASTRQRVRDQIIERVLRQAQVDRQVEAAMQELQPALAEAQAVAADQVAEAFKGTPTASWRNPIAAQAEALVRVRGRPNGDDQWPN